VAETNGDADQATTDLLDRLRSKGDDDFFVFLSHRFPDADLARTIKTSLQDLAPGRLHVWCAREDIPPGRQWNLAVREALRAADLFLLLYTEDEWRWDWCNWEAGLFDRCDPIDEPIVVLRRPGNSLPGPLQVYQAVDATAEAFGEFLEDLFHRTRLTRHRLGDAPLSSVSSERISAEADRIVDALGLERRSRYIPLQMNVRWPDAADPAEGIPLDAVVEADTSTLELFRVMVAPESSVTWGELTSFHRGREHLMTSEHGDRWIAELDDAVADLAARRTPDATTWRFRGHNRMGLYRPYLYKYERRGERLDSISLLILEEDAPRRVGGYRYNMLRSFERCWTEVVEFHRENAALLAAPPEVDEEAVEAWQRTQDLLREAVSLVCTEEAAMRPFEQACCDVVFGERHDSTDLGAHLERRATALDRIGELLREEEGVDVVALGTAVEELAAAITVLWPATADRYAEAVATSLGAAVDLTAAEPAPAPAADPA
jgi:TIR domain